MGVVSSQSWTYVMDSTTFELEMKIHTRRRFGADMDISSSKSSPAVFSAMMNRIFGAHMDDFVISYLDDLVIYSQTEEEHWNHLDLVFDLMEKHDLFVKRVKCTLPVKEVEFCGHTLTKEGVRISDDKRTAMQVTPILRNAADVRSFLGACVWFHRFIPDYAEITQPLSELVKKDSTLAWGPPATRSGVTTPASDLDRSGVTTLQPFKEDRGILRRISIRSRRLDITGIRGRLAPCHVLV